MAHSEASSMGKSGTATTPYTPVTFIARLKDKSFKMVFLGKLWLWEPYFKAKISQKVFLTQARKKQTNWKVKFQIHLWWNMAQTPRHEVTILSPVRKMVLTVTSSHKRSDTENVCVYRVRLRGSVYCTLKCNLMKHCWEWVCQAKSRIRSSKPLSFITQSFFYRVSQVVLAITLSVPKSFIFYYTFLLCACV